MSGTSNLAKWTAWAMAVQLLVSSVSAATNTAASAAYADVNTALGLCTHGDTLEIPSGDVTWTSTLNVNVAIIIRGAGTNTGATLSKLTKTSSKIIEWDSNSISNRKIKIEGLYLSGGSWTTSERRLISFTEPNSRSNLIVNFRITRCILEFGSRAICGPGYGVIDHVHLLNNDTDLHNQQKLSTEGADNEGTHEWEQGLRLGTSNYWVLENFTVRRDSGQTSQGNEVLYGQWASRYIMRHGKIQQSNDFALNAVDAHGRTRTEDWRGSHAYEVYACDFTWKNIATYRLFNIRGGSHLFYSNTFAGPISETNGLIQFKDEGVSTASLNSTNDFTTNCFVFELNFGGVTDESVMVNVETTPNPDSTPYVQQDVDYFLRAPQSGDAIYPYTQLVYPHPRVTAEDGGGGGGPTPAVTGVMTGPMTIRDGVIFR